MVAKPNALQVVRVVRIVKADCLAGSLASDRVEQGGKYALRWV